MPSTKPAPKELWRQFDQRTNLVCYEWEHSGMRLQHWRLLSELLPILPPQPPFNPIFVTSLTTEKRRRSPGGILENWLGGLAPMLGIVETITEVSLTGPKELTVVRRSPMGLSSLETVLLSHWLTGTGSGPIDPRLFGPRAKVIGPGGATPKH
jgi:hypothetical protein